MSDIYLAGGGVRLERGNDRNGVVVVVVLALRGDVDR